MASRWRPSSGLKARVLLVVALFALGLVVGCFEPTRGTIGLSRPSALWMPCASGSVLKQNGKVALQVVTGAALGGLTGLLMILRAGTSVGSAVSGAAMAHLPDRLICAGLLPHGLIEYGSFMLLTAASLFPLEMGIALYLRRPVALVSSVREFCLLSAVGLAGVAAGALVECHVTFWLLQRLA